MLVAPKEFIMDQSANKKITRIGRVQNIIFMNTILTPKEYEDIIDYLNPEENYKNQKSVQDYNIFYLLNKDEKKTDDDEEGPKQTMFDQIMISQQ